MYVAVKGGERADRTPIACWRMSGVAIMTYLNCRSPRYPNNLRSASIGS